MEGQKEPFLDDINDYLGFIGMIGRREKQKAEMEQQKAERENNRNKNRK